MPWWKWAIWIVASSEILSTAFVGLIVLGLLVLSLGWK